MILIGAKTGFSHSARKGTQTLSGNSEGYNIMTKTEKVLTALQEGQELTASQITARWNVGNPGSLIQSLRFKGFSVYLNTHTDTKGRVTRKYRLGSPSRRVVGAGYRAIAEGMVA